MLDVSTRITARPSNRELNNLGHSTFGRLMYADKPKTCHGVTEGMLNGDWRTRSNERSVKVKQTTVDTSLCL